jgi:YfiH family protein
MHSWNWNTWNGNPFLTCSLLDSFSHGFFTQQFAPAQPEALVTALNPTAEVFRVKQVHGNTVLTATEARQHLPSSEAETTFPHADGLVTEAEQQAIWVCTADCVPGLVADVKTGQVAAVHAGWRGTAQKILPQAIARLQAQGSQLSDLRVALGPAIAGEVYQVSTTVAAEVGSTVIHEPLDHITPEALLEHLRSLPSAPVLDDPQPGRARLDVRRVNVLQLEQLGFQPEQVAIAPYCTYQHGEHFFSYRRDRLKNVQWSGIVSQSPQAAIAS